jgi:ATP/maltotriose-dependent transcriptional regulator MalT
MNQVDMQCNHCQHRWRWLSGTPLRCPGCRHPVQVTPQSRNDHSQHTEKWPENQARKIEPLGEAATHRLYPIKIDETNDGPLTPREWEVLYLVAQGKSNRKVSEQLDISVRTVENHLHNIYGKIYVSSRTEAAVWALEKEMVYVRKMSGITDDIACGT